MNGFLEQLAERNLSEVEMPVRPRVSSRFELDDAVSSQGALHEEIPGPFDNSPAQPTNVAKERAADAMTSPQSSERDPQRPRDVARQDIGPIPRPPSPTRSESVDQHTQKFNPEPLPSIHTDHDSQRLRGRLDRLETELHRLSDFDVSAPSAPTVSIAEPAAPSHAEPSTSIVPNPRHEPSTREIVRDNRTLDRVTERLVEREIDRAPPPAPPVDSSTHDRRDNLQPNRGDTDPNQAAVPPTMAKSPPPIVVERQTPQKPMAQASVTPRRNPPPPKIIVERHSEPATTPTVRVSIGRIEVRPPKKETPTATARPQAAKPRIMSLDDYVRRRAGGAS